MISAAAVRDFQLTRVPQDFLDDPYPWYAALRERDRRIRFRGFRKLPLRVGA